MYNNHEQLHTLQLLIDRYSFQIGSYDPLSDDPQLGIQSVILNCSDETLFVAGTTGHVVILHFTDVERRREIEVCDYRAACCDLCVRHL